MRLEHLSDDEEDQWRGEFAQENWIFGALTLSVTLPEFAGGVPSLRQMHCGYYLQPLHLNADDREDLPRKLVHVLALRKPPLDFLQLSGSRLGVPHYLFRYRTPLLLGALCVLGSAVFSLAKPLIVGNAVNELATVAARGTLIRYGLLLVGAAAVEGMFLYLQRWIIIGVSRRIEYDIRNDFY